MSAGQTPVGSDDLADLEGRSVLVTGADGMLGRAFQEALRPLSRTVTVHARAHPDLDVTDARAVMACARLGPGLIVHCGGMALADECERHPDRARIVHVEGTRNVGRLAFECGARVVYPQSVFIFDGRELPVTETTTPNPPMVYGRMKLEAERYLLDEVPRSLVVRMAGFFGGDDRDKNFVGKFVRELDAALRRGESRIEVGDRVWQPTYTLDLARNTVLLAARERSGIYNMGALGEATFFEVARVCIDELGMREHISLEPSPAEVFAGAEPARRPHRMVTANLRLEREGLLRQRRWDVALREYLSRPWFDRFRRASAPRREVVDR
jgi:dTDP-4-dehydrorhamnose reductase